MISNESQRKLDDLKIKELEKLPTPQKSFDACETCDNLIDFLDREFPEKSPNPGETLADIWSAAGKREVVRILLDFRAARDLNIEEERIKNSTGA